jgi:hypothetical protein
LKLILFLLSHRWRIQCLLAVFQLKQPIAEYSGYSVTQTKFPLLPEINHTPWLRGINKWIRNMNNGIRGILLFYGEFFLEGSLGFAERRV